MRQRSLLCAKRTVERDAIRIAMIRNSLFRAEGNISFAARLLEMDPANLRREMRRLKYPGYPKNISSSL